MYVATIQCLNNGYNKKKKKGNLQFIFMNLKPLWHWNKVKVINDKVDPKQGYNHDSLEDLALMVSEKKPAL